MSFLLFGEVVEEQAQSNEWINIIIGVIGIILTIITIVYISKQRKDLIRPHIAIIPFKNNKSDSYIQIYGIELDGNKKPIFNKEVENKSLSTISASTHNSFRLGIVNYGNSVAKEIKIITEIVSENVKMIDNLKLNAKMFERFNIPVTDDKANNTLHELSSSILSILLHMYYKHADEVIGKKINYDIDVLELPLKIIYSNIIDKTFSDRYTLRIRIKKIDRNFLFYSIEVIK